MSAVACLNCGHAWDTSRFGMHCSKCDWQVPSPPYHPQTVDETEYELQRLRGLQDELEEIKMGLIECYQIADPGDRATAALAMVGRTVDVLIKDCEQNYVLVQKWL